MKMLFIVYDVELDEDVMGTIMAFQSQGYTKWDRVLGRGGTSEPKLDDSVWPGFNCAVAMAVEESKEDEVLNVLENLSKRFEKTSFKVFEFPVLRVI